MALKIMKTEVWAASIQDKPGGLAEKLEALAKAGAALEFVIARRAPDKPGTGVLFVAPVKGDKAVQAAEAAGFSRTDSLHSSFMDRAALENPRFWQRSYRNIRHPLVKRDFRFVTWTLNDLH